MLRRKIPILAVESSDTGQLMGGSRPKIVQRKN
jgi:hypothetical protein